MTLGVGRRAEDVGMQFRTVAASASDAQDPGSTAYDARPTAIVTWAHRGARMSEEDAQEWERSVAEFTTALRQFGIDADVDLYHLDDVGVDWTRFGPREIERRDFVIIAVSPSWSERWQGVNPQYEGAGAALEADALKGLFQKDQQAFQERVKIVVLPGQTDSAIPAELMRLTRYSVDPSNPDTFEDLLRALTAQPRYPVPSLGAIPALHPRIAAGMTRSTGRARGMDDYGRLARELRHLDAEIRGLPDDASTTEDRQRLLQRRAAIQGILDAVSSAD